MSLLRVLCTTKVLKFILKPKVFRKIKLVRKKALAISPALSFKETRCLLRIKSIGYIINGPNCRVTKRGNIVFVQHI